MSQRNVEILVGRLVLEEALRARFVADRRRTLAGLLAEGLELTAVEVEALAGLDPRALERFARAIDARLQMASLARPASPQGQRREDRQ